MAIKIRISTKKKTKQHMEGTAFDRWYKAHAGSFNEERRKRYHTDKEYRDKILTKARNSRDKRRKGGTKPLEYAVSLADAAASLDVSIWTLRNWRANEYFPEPFKFNGELWFTLNQVGLLLAIRDHVSGVRRMSAQQREELEVIVQKIYASW